MALVINFIQSSESQDPYQLE